MADGARTRRVTPKTTTQKKKACPTPEEKFKNSVFTTSVASKSRNRQDSLNSRANAMRDDDAQSAERYRVLERVGEGEVV